MVTARTPAFAVEWVIGASHRQNGKPCQDRAGGRAAGDAVAVAVADGHGESEHADIGAQLAIRATLAALERFAHDNERESADLRAVAQAADHPLRVRIVREWKEMVRADAERKGKSVDGDRVYRDYGSTILGAVATPKFLLLGQLGDGNILLVDEEGHVRTPLSGDSAQIGDETESLCLPGAEYALGTRVMPRPEGEALLLLATDGYSKSYESDSIFEKIGPDYLDRIRDKGIDEVANRLTNYLREVTDRGSGDDIAVAMLYWPPPGARPSVGKQRFLRVPEFA